MLNNLSRRARLAIGGVGLAGVVGATGVVLTNPGHGIALAAAETSACTVGAVGDIAGADDKTTGAAVSVKALTGAEVTKAVILGDIDYDDTASLSNYRQSYDAVAGKALAVKGNHDTTAGMTKVFGAASVTNRSVQVCGNWRLVLVNQYGSGAVSAGATFIANERKAHPDDNLIVAWHEPWRTSGSEHGTAASATVAPLWKAAVAAKARVVLGAHDHDNEAFEPMDVAGTKSPGGPQLLVAGSGGHHMRPFGTIRANSIAASRKTGTPSVLHLDLRQDGGYDWRYVAGKDGAVLASGTRAPAVVTPTSTATTTTAPVPTSTSTSTSTASATAAGDSPLSISGTRDRANAIPVPRDGSLIVKGNVFFFTPSTSVSKVTFKIDGGTTLTEGVKPLDAKGTAADGTANPLVTTGLAEGEHTIVVDAVTPNLAATTYTFTVDNVADETPEPTSTQTVDPGPGPSDTPTEEPTGTPTATPTEEPSGVTCLPEPADPALAAQWRELVAASA